MSAGVTVANGVAWMGGVETGVPESADVGVTTDPGVGVIEGVGVGGSGVLG